MGEHPAARMRAAAKLLRDLAAAATGETGDGHGGWEPSFFAGPIPGQLAEYIAMMNPMVATAVAGLLEDAAGDAERLLIPRAAACPHWEEERSCDCATTRTHYCGRCAGYYPIGCRCWGRPLEITRILLGEEE